MLADYSRRLKTSMGIYDPRPDHLYGLLAEFSDPHALYEAARQVREAGYDHFDVHSPFPIHGMDRAMGLGNSRVGYIALGGGVAGFLLAVWLQWFTSAIDYPLNIGGKPFFAIEPYVPIMFELTILFTAFAAVAGMLALNGLPRPYNPLFYSRHFHRVTDNAFFLHIAASDQNFDRSRTEQLLKSLGALHVEVIEDREVIEAEEQPARA